MAIDAQQATTDKWYARYYQLSSDRKDHNFYQSTPNLVHEPPVSLKRPQTKRSLL